jgi:hypothetical protein
MNPITIIEGRDLDDLIADLTRVVMPTGRPGWPYRLRIHQMSDGRLKYKVNEGTWTPAIGTNDEA